MQDCQSIFRTVLYFIELFVVFSAWLKTSISLKESYFLAVELISGLKNDKKVSKLYKFHLLAVFIFQNSGHPLLLSIPSSGSSLPSIFKNVSRKHFSMFCALTLLYPISTKSM